MDPSSSPTHVVFAFTRRWAGPQPATGRGPREAQDRKDKLWLDDRTRREGGEEILTLLFSELSPVCAIVGVLAQEVIKAISNKDVPSTTTFFTTTRESAE